MNEVILPVTETVLHEVGEEHEELVMMSVAAELALRLVLRPGGGQGKIQLVIQYINCGMIFFITLYK